MVPEQLQPEDPWSHTGITPTNSSSQLGMRYDSNKPVEPAVLDETNDMGIAMNHVDPILSLANEFYDGDDPEEDVEDDFDLGVGQIVHFSEDDACSDDGDRNEATNDLFHMTDTSQNMNETTFVSAVSSTEDSFLSALDQSSLLSQSRNDGSFNTDNNTNDISPYFAKKKKSSRLPAAQTSTPIHGNASGQSNKRPTSPLVNPIAKKPSQTNRMKMPTFVPPLRKDPNESPANPTPSTSRQSTLVPFSFSTTPSQVPPPDRSSTVNEDVEATRQSFSRAGISEHQPLTMEERTSMWPSWLKMHNPKNACWLNSTTNGLIWTLKSQGIASIGRPPNTPPGQWRPLDFFRSWFGLEVGAPANPTLLLQKLASRKRQPELARNQFPAEKLFELKEFIECWYKRLCPILHIKRSAEQCTNRFCVQTADPQESFSMEHMLSLTFKEGASSQSLQEMVLRFCDATYLSDCEFCGHENSVTRKTQTLIRDPKDGIILICKRVKFINGVRVSNHSINFAHPSI